VGGLCRRPAVLWALPLSGPQMLAHIYIPRNRTPRGRGLGGVAYRLSWGCPSLSGCAPLALSDLIIAQAACFVKTFFRRGEIFFSRSRSAVVWHPPSGLFGIPRPLLFSRESGSSDVSAQRVRREPLPLALAGALPDFYTAQGAGLPLAVGLTLSQRRLAVEILGSWRISCALRRASLHRASGFPP